MYHNTHHPIRTVCSFRRRQAGMTLMEMMIVLGIIGLLLGAAAMFGNTSSNSQSGTQHTTELNGLRQAMRGLFNGQGNYGNATAGTYTSANAALISAQQVPATLVVSGTTSITNKWGGAVTVQGSLAQFYVSTASVPMPVCVSIVSQAIQAGWTSVSVGATYSAGATAVVSPTAAATTCATTGGIIYLTSN